MKKFSRSKLKTRRFQFHIFISLLSIGIIPVILLGGFTTLFSSKIIEDTYREQSEKKMKLLVADMNRKIELHSSTLFNLSQNKDIKNTLFSSRSISRATLSNLYQNLYKEMLGPIEDVSIHLINGTKVYSTHKIPDIYNPNTEEQILTTYLKLKPEREIFPIVDPFINPEGERIALSLFKKISTTFSSGFIILDIKSEQLGRSLERINTSFFSDLFIIDSINHKYIDVLRRNSSGNYTELQNIVPKNRSGIIQSKGTLIAYNTLDSSDLILVGTIRYDTISANLSVLTRTILIISLIGIIISSIVAYALSKNVTRPVTVLSKAMKKIEQGEFSIQVEDFKEDEFEILFHGFNNMSSRIKSLLDARVEREKALRTAERLALQAQINPHFLYNTLNTVKAISKLNNVPQITTIITELGKLLRDSIDTQEEFTTVEESLKLVEAYLKIQKIRYGENFKWIIKKDPILNSKPIPRLIVQPIVENSVIHGLENLVGEKKVEVICSYNPPIITVRDNGGGMTEERWERAISGDHRVGLHNVYKRLKLYYGDSAGLTYSRENNLSCIQIHL